ncbi:DUF805 domain-containing protein [Actinoplanes sp. NEAU-A12]|uniref:DUF805 domain-containing protein n=1 Tax=Actinoplanes sandaracinus TaxID=3045177 RepID=A0ABT6WYF5_9ACTN|nr:DUF805 domain-containing protein [Actinoplanes sandaracinus]MDI6104719.1 DUF805 domain-containing protein [Actinoplanes sandaracinus]
MHWYLVGLRKYARFDGRARRAEFWMFTLADAAVGSILFGGALAIALNSDGGYYAVRLAIGVGFAVYVLATLLPSLAIRARRLHDTGRSGWYICWSLLPIAGPIILLVALCEEGTRGPNAYGPDPKSPPWPGPAVDPAAAAHPFGPPATSSPPYASSPEGQPVQPYAFLPSGQQFGPPVTAPAAPPTAKQGRASMIAAVAMSLLLLVVCGGVVRGLVTRASDTNAAADPSAQIWSKPQTGSGPDAGATGSRESGSEGPGPSTYPAKTIGDLDRVCNDDIFYPQSPKRSGKAPHPVVVLVETGDGSDIRVRNGSYFFEDEGLTEQDTAIWGSDDPSTVQLVACLDRVSTGTLLRKCEYGDPAPETVSLMRADWQLRIYEAATGVKIHDKVMTGDEKKCPYSVRVGPDRTIYAEVSGRSLTQALRKYVKK